MKSFDITWEKAHLELHNELEFPLILEVVGVDLMKKLFCLRLMELKVEEEIWWRLWPQPTEISVVQR